MSRCYLCGKPISDDERQIRRRVRTGDRTRTSYTTGKALESVTTFGRRVVCARCARFLDRSSLRNLLCKHSFVLLLLTLLMIYLLYLTC